MSFIGSLTPVLKSRQGNYPRIAGNSGKEKVQIRRSDGVNGVLNDATVKQNQHIKSTSLFIGETDGSKIKGIRWATRPKKAQVPEEQEPTLYGETGDYTMTELHRERKLQDQRGALYNPETEVKVPSYYQRKDYSNPFEKQNNGEFVPKYAKNEVRHALFKKANENMQEQIAGIMDYSQVFAGAEQKAQARKQATTPRVIYQIEGATPKRMTYDRVGTDFNQFNTNDIEGATPKKKTFLMGSGTESLAAGQRPVATSGKTPNARLKKHFEFGGNFGMKPTEKKTFYGSALAQKQKESKGMASVIGQTTSDDIAPQQRRTNPGRAKNYASTAIASIMNHPQ